MIDLSISNKSFRKKQKFGQFRTETDISKNLLKECASQTNLKLLNALLKGCEVKL